MTDTFDWAGLTAEIVKGHFAKYPLDLLHLLRTRIEAAFVPVERYIERNRMWTEQVLATNEATARAEAAEARVKVLEMHVDILEQALIDHNCGSPSCLCVGCIEKRDPALGDEHGK